MPDRATPNLPSQDLVATSRFYARLGFHEAFRDDGWLILERGSIQLEFFPHTGLNPRGNIASCCLRVSDARTLHAAFAVADLPSSARAIPRLTLPIDQPWGFREFALVDPDGNLLRCLEPISPSPPRRRAGQLFCADAAGMNRCAVVFLCLTTPARTTGAVVRPSRWYCYQ